MKNLLTILAAILLTTIALLPRQAIAQSPEKMKYQAVARDNAGNVISNQLISFRISILPGSSTGASVYTETHQTTTNDFGLANLDIGNGTLVSGDFTSIAWSADLHFLKVELDPTGGSAFQLMGTSQLLSVPYALHAKTVDSINETDPVFGASVANGISANDTSYWNNKLSTEIDGSVAINSDGANSDVSAILDVISSDKGVLMPRMTQEGIAAIENQANGLIVYNTDNSRFYFYDGLAGDWKEMSIGAGTITPSLPVEVYNPTTGETWMDRNLGASRRATSSGDNLAIGDLYQWGRATEGHENRSSLYINNYLATTPVPNEGNPGVSEFI